MVGFERGGLVGCEMGNQIGCGLGGLVCFARIGCYEWDEKVNWALWQEGRRADERGGKGVAEKVFEPRF